MTESTQVDLVYMGKQARQAARHLGQLSTDAKNEILISLAHHLRSHESDILAANVSDLEQAKVKGLSKSMLDRLKLDAGRLESICKDVENVAKLSDPVGEVLDSRELMGGMTVERRRTPLGVVGVIYEARPNVTIDVASLCLKAGNAVILRGGKETFHTNLALMKVIALTLEAEELPVGAIQLIPSQDRDYVRQLLRLDQYVDMIIPRGGAGLHQYCKENSTIPVITGGIGVCHIFADSFLDLDQAVNIIHNAKVQRPTVCNALDTLLVHHLVAPDLMPLLAQKLSEDKVQIRADVQAFPYLEKENYPHLLHSTHDDFGTEFLDLILSVRIVEHLDEALDHIDSYGSGHSDAILTLKSDNAERFLNEVDSAAVYLNASTRFTDGAQFGLGAEVAVSTQKLHARGPMALEGLTTYKWIVRGKWNARP